MRMHVILAMMLSAWGMGVSGCDQKNQEKPAPGGPAKMDGKESSTMMKDESPKLQEAKLGETPNVHQFGNVYLAGQPSEEDLDAVRAAGVKTVINLRTAGELTYDEEKAVKDRGMTYVHVPIGGDTPLSADQIEKVRAILKDSARHPVLVHCKSAGRVGMVWTACRAVDGGLTVEAAKAEGATVGAKGNNSTVDAFIAQHKKP